jgi:beta-fructofuranosidase
MMISSGERGPGPQLHIYQSDNLLEWKFVATILTVLAESIVSPTSTLKFGMNFECASFFSFGERQYIVVGVEEGHNSEHHDSRYLLWMSGNLVLEAGMPKFNIKSHGVLDHGISYAAHIFRDSEGRLLQLGWINENVEKHVIADQNWAGCLSHPRELYEISRPVSGIRGGGDIWDIDETSGTMTTLGIRPAPQVSALRDHLRPLSSLAMFSHIQSLNYSIEAIFRNLTGDEKITFNVRQSPRSVEVTKIIFDMQAGLITVDRSRSSLQTLGGSSLDSGPFHLLPDEDIEIEIFVDNSILEIYVNDRFALSSRIYPSLETSLGASYDFGSFHEGDIEFRCWEGLNDAWPKRKVDESDLIEVDSPLEIVEEKLISVSEDFAAYPICSG